MREIVLYVAKGEQMRKYLKEAKAIVESINSFKI